MSVFTRSLDKKGKGENLEGRVGTLLKLQGATSTCKKGVIIDLQQPITMLSVVGEGVHGQWSNLKCNNQEK